MSVQVSVICPKARVVKVGGSLLDWPLLGTILSEWLAQQPSARNVLIAGGGELVEAIRRLDAAHSLDDETAHWLSIDAMGITARLLAVILGAAEPTKSLADLREQTAAAEHLIVFDSGIFLRDEEPHLPGEKLPRDWSVTSDSIAARIAQVIAADELVLLKSQKSPTDDWRELARAGYVDEHFSRAAAGLASVRMINLRGVTRPAAPASAD